MLIEYVAAAIDDTDHADCSCRHVAADEHLTECTANLAEA